MPSPHGYTNDCGIEIEPYATGKNDGAVHPANDDNPDRMAETKGTEFNDEGAAHTETKLGLNNA